MTKRLRNALFSIGVPITLAALAAGGASGLIAAAKMHPSVHIRAGLWEFNSSGKVAGDTVFRDALLAHVPPAQRAPFLAQLREQIAQPNKERICVTQAFFERLSSSDEGGCKQTVISNTSSRLEVQKQCVAEDHGWRDASRSTTIVSPTESAMSEHGVSTKAGKTMIRDTVQRGHWVSSNCGGLQPFAPN